MSESEYKRLVLSDYDRQMAAHLLPSELLVPTPANIKSEVVKICERGPVLSAGDEKILRSFVGEREDAAAYRNAFQNGKADPFRQVVKLLGDRSVNTNVKYINLLALLIGFKPRPYHPNLHVTGFGHSPVKPPEPAIDPVCTDPKPAKKSFNRKLAILLPILFLSLFAFLFWNKAFKHHTGHEGCMIWNDDHYDTIECNDPSYVAPHYRLNHRLVDHFKRIRQQDTLTYWSVRKVWYSNYKGRVEFYTDSGPNPLDTNLRVLPMTTHILEKYVLHITN